MAAPNLLFGAGGIGTGWISHTWTTPEDVKSLLPALRALELMRLDSGASYPPGAAWVTETLLGQTKAAEEGFVIDTKVLVRMDGGPSLTAERIRESIEKSLRLLGVEKVNVLYAHRPDPHTLIEETARAFDEQYRAGRCEKLGICSYSREQVEEFMTVCEEKGYVKPSVYQGHYNVLCRHIEKELFPLLRKHNMTFVAYGPLAGGFLTGKVTFPTTDTDLSKGRWAEGRFPMYPSTFDKPEVHAAMNIFRAGCEKHGISMTDASLRWLIHHSKLGEEDGLVLGATRVDQLSGNVEACRGGPLPEGLLGVIDEVWKETKGAIPFGGGN